MSNKFKFDPEKFESPLLQPVTIKAEKVKGWKRIYKWRMNRRLWRIKNDWIYFSEHLQMFVKIPDGFTFDGASVPKIFNSIITSTDGIFFGSIPHDFIYRLEQLIVCYPNEDGSCSGHWFLRFGLKRKTADEMLYNLSYQLDGSKIPNGIAYWVIRPLGVFAWRSHRKRGWFLTTPYPKADHEYLASGA